jgi:Flp pilus assembly pilin Flp
MYSFNEKGQGLVEYALIIALIALALVAALMFFGENFFGIRFAEIVQYYITHTTP